MHNPVVDPIPAPAVVDTPAAALLQFEYNTGAAYHALEGNARVLSEERCKAVLMLKDLRGKVEAEKPWYRRQTNVFSYVQLVLYEFRRRSVLPVEDDDHNGSGTSQIQIGPLRQAFILFIYVSAYTAGFGRFWMSAEKLDLACACG
jgi:hypothetical protein